MNIFRNLLQETIQIIPAIIFFAITFNLIVLTEKLMIRQNQPSFLSYTLATISALIAGKFLLIVNNLPYINAFPQKPLIYNILWKCFLYGICIIIFRIIDKLLHLIFEYHGHEIMYYQLIKILSSPTFWAIQIWLYMSFIVYIVSSEFIRVIGKDKINKILFGQKL